MAFDRWLRLGIVLVTISTGWIVSDAFAFTGTNRPTRIWRPLSASATSMSHWNHLIEFQSLRNDYYALRHGQSLANVAKIIASNPATATSNYGLSDVGREQANQAARDVVDLVVQNNHQYQGVVILSSDLLRAKETADAVAAALVAQVPHLPLVHQNVVMDVRLRERSFGNWDGKSDVHYHDVWKEDALDPTHEKENVESVNSVMERATRCIVEWDSQVAHHLILCVAHGDVLQILQTAFCKMDGSLHRTQEHLDTAKLRRLTLPTDLM